MSDTSAIEWTDATWNPVTGCSKVSPGCANCYAETLSLRFGWSTKPWTPENAAENVVLHPERLLLPTRWRQPRRVFVNSMSDLFHEEVPLEFIERVFDVMGQASWHRFQILTKRADRLAELGGRLRRTPNIWMGVSVETAAFVSRVEHLRATGAKVEFLSLEPLLGPLHGLDLHGIDWVIVGGESGPKARPMDPAWVLDLRDQCQRAGIPFFFKQWGGANKKKAGRLLEGRTWDEVPAAR
jgi:protein gp37